MDDFRQWSPQKILLLWAIIMAIVAIILLCRGVDLWTAVKTAWLFLMRI